MLLPLYLFSIGLSSGLVGIYARHFLALAGYIPNFEIGMMAALGVAAGFAAVQLSIMAGIQLVGPTTSSGPLFTGSIAQWAAFCLIPPILQFDIPWPHDILYKIEPLIFLGAFLLIHGSLLLITLFTALQSKPASRMISLLWAAAAVCCFLGSSSILHQWRDDLNGHQRIALTESTLITLNNYQGMAQALPEGTAYTFPLPERFGRDIVLRWTADDTLSTELEQLYVTLEYDNTFSAAQQHEVVLLEKNWAELSIADSDIPEGATSCTVHWNAEAEAPWVTLTGVRPVVASSREVYLAEPRFVQQRTGSETPNFVIVLVEGLAAAHVGHLGYKRNTTPFLDQFAESALIFEQAETPSPEVPAATMSLLTGFSPLEHGYFEGGQGPLSTTDVLLPFQLQQLGYATAAFTEGAGADAQDLVLGTEFTIGFDTFVDHYPVATPEKDTTVVPGEAIPMGAQHTLSAALSWMEQHQTQHFGVLIRIRELRNPKVLVRYDDGFLQDKRNPAAMDIYDTALLSVDTALGNFLNQLQELKSYSNTGIIITSPYGIDFSREGQEGRYLSEASLQVPLLMKLPGQSPRKRSDLVGLEDIAPTLLRLAGAPVVAGNNMLMFGERKQHVSMMGNPLALSLRTRPWRFTWLSGRNPFTMEQKAGALPLALHDMSKYRLGYNYRVELDKNPTLVQEYEKALKDYLESQQ